MNLPSDATLWLMSVIRGQKGEFRDLFEDFGSRAFWARVDGETVGYPHHRIWIGSRDIMSRLWWIESRLIHAIGDASTKPLMLLCELVKRR